MKNNAVRILLSLVIAFVLWMYVITVVSPNSEDTFYNIPVNLRGESILKDRGLMITSDEIPKVNMKLSGNRTDLNKITSDNITLVADLSTIDKPGTQTLFYSHAFPGDVASDAITVLERSPDRITITVERMASKSIPINIVYLGILSEEYMADRDNVLLTDVNETVLEDGAVRVTGPESVMDDITQARIEIDLTDRNATFREGYRFTLCDKDDKPVDAEHVTAELAEVYVTLYIQKVKEIPLKLQVIDGGGATAQTSQITYEPRTIKIAGNETALAELNEYLLGTINLGELTENTELKFPITLPDEVTNLAGITEITVSVQFPELQTREFVVTNIVTENLPENMEVEIAAKQLPVKVRGPKELVEKMTEEDITVSVDLTNAQPGTAEFKANIILSDAYTQVGAMGINRVAVTLRAAE